MLRAVLAGVVGLALAASVGAQTKKDDDKEWLESPYQLTVQLHVQEHPLMTPVFLRTIERELVDTLQSDLNQLCRVTLTTQKSATMEDIIANGWGKLDKLHPVNDQKTHYVRVLYLEGGQYEIQARQVDGYTGLVSPLRKARTSDRLWVARQAALMIAQDFGMVGKVVENVDRVFRVKLKGAKLAEPDSVRVQPGEVLALTRMTRLRDGRVISDRPEDALLYVIGVQKEDATTRLFNRYNNVMGDRRGKMPDFRVIKLGTRWAPLQLRIVDRKTREPIPGIQVAISSGGERVVPIGATDAQGRVRSKDIYRNVAFVQITVAGQVSSIPLPLLDDQFVDFALAGNQEAERMSDFNIYYNQWQRRVDESFHAFAAGETQIRELVLRGSEAEALREAKELYTRANEDLVAIRDGHSKVKDAAAPAGEQAERKVKEAQKFLDSLGKRLARLDETIKDWENPSPASLKIKEGQVYEESAEPAKAIEAFEAAVKLDPSRTRIKQHLDELKAVWNKKAPDLDKARAFVFDTWHTVEPEDMDKRLGELEEAVKAIEKHGDSLTAYKLWKVNFDHRTKLAASRNSLNPDRNAEDEDRAAFLDRHIEAINKYNARALEIMDQGAKE
jgi:tetratricopeptide (TPR) repeat protein